MFLIFARRRDALEREAQIKGKGGVKKSRLEGGEEEEEEGADGIPKVLEAQLTRGLVAPASSGSASTVESGRKMTDNWKSKGERERDQKEREEREKGKGKGKGKGEGGEWSTGKYADDVDVSKEDAKWVNVKLEPGVKEVLIWLRQTGWEQYEEMFAMNQIDYPELFRLTEEDLKDMGMKLGSNRRQLLEQIEVRFDQHGFHG
jgi:hypothetical protein